MKLKYFQNNGIEFSRGKFKYGCLFRLGALGFRKGCEGVGDVVGVVTPLGGVAQVIFHGVKVVEVGVVLRVHQDRGEEEDGKGQVEVEREEGEVKENHTCLTME